MFIKAMYRVSKQDGVSEHGAAFRVQFKGLAGQIQLLLVCVQVKCELCSEPPLVAFSWER